MVTEQPHLLDWLQLIRAEFDDLPGLKLSQSEVEEMWGLDATMADALLAALVSAGVLRRTDDMKYVRLEQGSRYTPDA